MPVLPLRWIAPDWMGRGHSFAHDTRWAAVGNRLMSSPISARMICASPGLMPGISSSRSIVVDSRAPCRRDRARRRRARWGPRGDRRRGLGFHRGEQLVDAGGEGADLGGQRVDLVEQHPGQFGVMIVESAGQRLDQGGLFGFHPAARQAGERRGSRSPAINASIMSRTDSVSRVEATADTLINASSSSFSNRCQ